VDYPPRGRSGGASGAAGIVRLGNGKTLNAKGRQTIPAGETLVLEMPGGGGHGDPHTRAPAAVAEDVRNGFVSAAQARDVYGVALTGAGDVDETATAILRRMPHASD
jgi:N-methylhydantoinase B